MVTKEQVTAAVQKMVMVGMAVKEAGPEGIPSGHLYATLMGSMTLETYNRIIAELKRQRIINEKNNVLTFIA